MLSDGVRQRASIMEQDSSKVHMRGLVLPVTDTHNTVLAA